MNHIDVILPDGQRQALPMIAALRLMSRGLATMPSAAAAPQRGFLVRDMRFDLAARRSTGDARIPVVVSSDAAVEMADGPEILVHTADAIDLQRAPLPIIATHRGGQVNVGLVEDLRPVAGVMRGMARFGDRDEAKGYAHDVASGIIRCVSVGYQRLKSQWRDGVLVTSRWMPTHVALVAEPADINAGFYRAPIR